MSDLPEPLRRYYERALTHLPTQPHGSLIEQRGEMRFAPDAKWLPFTAEQWFAATKTAFHWHARVKMAPLVTAVVDDAFEDGQGKLDAKIWSVIPVAHARGVDVDRGEAQRYLAELPWNPMAIKHNAELQFCDGEDGATRVWYREEQTHVDVRFDEEGDIAGVFSRTRCKDDEPLPWEGRFFEYADFAGVRIPTKAEVSWHLPAGPFVYWRGTITRFGWREPAPLWAMEPPAVVIPT